jgi:hypothetical protein
MQVPLIRSEKAKTQKQRTKTEGLGTQYSDPRMPQVSLGQNMMRTFLLAPVMSVALIIMATIAGISHSSGAPKNYSNGERVTCEGVIKRDPDSGTWLDSTRMCSQTFWQDLERVLEACPEGSRCEVTAIIVDDKHRMYGFGQIINIERKN